MKNNNDVSNYEVISYIGKDISSVMQKTPSYVGNGLFTVANFIQFINFSLFAFPTCNRVLKEGYDAGFIKSCNKIRSNFFNQPALEKTLFTLTNFGYAFFELNLLDSLTRSNSATTVYLTLGLPLLLTNSASYYYETKRKLKKNSELKNNETIENKLSEG